MRKLIYILIFMLGASVQGAYIKNLVHLDGDRDNQLVGYGLVVGLDGKGDTSFSENNARKQQDKYPQKYLLQHEVMLKIKVGKCKGKTKK